MRKLILIAVCISLLLAGCWDYKEIDFMAPVLAIGLDRVPGSKMIFLTVQIANPESKKGSSQSEEQGETYLVMNSEGKTFGEAIRKLNSQSTRRILLSHCRLDIFGKNFAEMGIGEIIDDLKRHKDSRRTDWILTTDMTAKEILEENMAQEKVPARGLDLILQNLSKTGSVWPMNRNDFFIRFNEDSHVSFTPLVQLDNINQQISRQLEKTTNRSLDSEKEPKIIDIKKTAVFKNFYMVGILNEDDTKAHRWLVDSPKGSSLTLSVSQADGGKEEVMLDFTDGQKIITPQISKDGITMNIEMTAKATIHEVETTGVKLLDPKVMTQLELQAADTMKLKLEHIINTAQRELKSDCVGFAESIHNTYPSEWKKIKDNWDDIFPMVNYQVSCKIKILGTGVITNPTLKNEPEK